MSTTGSFNTKSPTIKRILKEAHELSTSPSPDYHASPLETNLFEWHFTLRGPPSSAFSSGLYHGRIVLPPTYPLRPPSFRFLTPSGRFEQNREICLSISGFHEESWQPAWGLRTAIVALRSFMETEAKGQVGGVEASREVRERLARESRGWKCGKCGRCNEDIMREVGEAAESVGREAKVETVPEELRLGYKDELGKGEGSSDGAEKVLDAKDDAAAKPASTEIDTATTAATVPASDTPAIPPSAAPTRTTTAISTRPTPNPTATIQLQSQSQPAWIDKAIAGVAIALAFMLLKKFLAMTA